jgi:subtilase family serine protease
VLAVLTTLGLLTGFAAPPTAAATGARPAPRATPASRAVCPPAHGRTVSCQARVVTESGSLRALALTGPSGITPVQLSRAYGLPDPRGDTWVPNGRKVVIVDAYDNPHAEFDLAVYRQTFGLPPCTTANGCFKKISQDPALPLPPGNVAWGQEIDLDLQMASAICPRCKLTLVAAASADLADIARAVARAHSRKTSAISNSYATDESPEAAFFEPVYDDPGIAVTAASGDAGYAATFPASSPHVIAVGGTTLTRDVTTPRGWTETAWSGGGSWCSSLFDTQPWQSALVSGDPSGAACTRRTVADVAVVGDPVTGVAVYDSYGSVGGDNWYVFGGTSVGAPIVGALFALAGDAVQNPTYPYPAQRLYEQRAALHDVTSGYNGNTVNDCWPASASPYYLCHAQAGYDGPTGLGTPNGLTAF